MPIRYLLRCLLLSILVLSSFAAASQEDVQARIELLTSELQDEDAAVRWSAASALGQIGPPAAPAVSALRKALTDKAAIVRLGAAYALGMIGLAAVPAVPALREMLKDEGFGVQETAAHALVDIAQAVDAQALVAQALGQVGPPAEPAVPALSEALKDAAPVLGEALKNESVFTRHSSAEALGMIGPAAEPAVLALAGALRDKDVGVRLAAARALKQIGLAAKAAVPGLTAALQDEDDEVRWAAAQALGLIATALQDADAVGAVSVLREARDALEAHQDPYVRENYVLIVGRAVRYLEARQPGYMTAKIIPWMKSHPETAAALIFIPTYLACCLSLSLMLLLVRPTAILQINDALRPLEFALPGWLGGMRIALRHLMLVGLLNYRPRVLDAWVARHADAAQENFERKRTVDERSVHVPVPVELDGERIPELQGEDLQRVFGTRGTGRLLIWGEGGAGKTSLACQIARWGMTNAPGEQLAPHRMLPVLIERELDFEVAEGKDLFTETVRGDLAKLIGAPVSVDLLQALLEQRRVLVIVDHMSEMTETTRKRVRPDVPDFPAGMLIVTSRLEEDLGNVPKSSLKPLRVTGDYLFEFMGTYLRAQGVREWFPDREFGPAGARIAELVGERPVTVLLVKLYLDRMIETKRRQGDLNREMPESIPSLMLQYLNDINRAVPEETRQDARDVHRDTEAIAWACLQERLVPAAASIDSAVKPALAAIDAEGVNARLDYLERRLRLIETLEPARDRVRFLLDPVAEYLAGLHLVGCYKTDESQWREFLAQADAKPGGLEIIRGFLLSLRDCCLARKAEWAVPELILDELTKRAELDPEQLKEARLRQRIARYVGQLKAADPGDRKIAADVLAEMGPAAAAAVPMLVEALQQDEDIDVRTSAAEALERLGSAAGAAVPALIEILKHDELRLEAIWALGAIKSEAAVPALTEMLKDDDARVRENATASLAEIGPAAETAVPTLIEALKDDEVRIEAVGALAAIGSAALSDLIKALKDESGIVRSAAAEALRKIGPAGKKAVPALCAAQEDDDARVREAAAAALRAIECGEESVEPSSRVI